MSQRRLFSSHGNILDSLAVGLSLTCLVHCLALPVLIALLPAWSAWLDVPESFHMAALAIAAPFSLTVLLRAKKYRPGLLLLWLAAGGLGLMALGLVMPTEEGETIITSLGAMLLAFAHILNWRHRNHAKARGASA